jgi:hypothetical protein
VQSCLFKILAALLLLSASLKAYAHFYGHLQVGWFDDPRLRLLTIEWEAILGIWLLVGQVGLATWVAAFLTFTGFATVSGILGVSGAKSCGCLGLVHISPWWMFSLDLLAISSLLWLRPTRLELTSGSALKLGAKLGAIGIVCLAFAGFANTKIGKESQAKIRGDGVVVPAEVDLGVGQADEWLYSSITITNWIEVPVRVYGGSTACNFDILVDCPAIIQPRTTITLRVGLRLPGEIGQHAFNVKFWVSDEAGSVSWDVPFALIGTTLGDAN